LEDVDLRGCRRDTLCRNRGANQRIDERAFSGIEFPDYDQQKQFVELFNRTIKCLLMLGRGVEADEGAAQPCEDSTLLFDQLILSAG
jgi:hypothetical protein